MTYNKAIHLLSHSTPGNLCMPAVHSAMICLAVIISITHIRVKDMSFITGFPFFHLKHPYESIYEGETFGDLKLCF